jgi:hypothetical protein
MCKEIGEDPYFKDVCEVCGGTGKTKKAGTEKEPPLPAKPPASSMPPPERISPTKRKAEAPATNPPPRKRQSVDISVDIAKIDLNEDKENIDPDAKPANDTRTAESTTDKPIKHSEKSHRHDSLTVPSHSSTDQKIVKEASVLSKEPEEKTNTTNTVEECPECGGQGLVTRECRWCDGSGLNCNPIDGRPALCPQFDCEYRQMRIEGKTGTPSLERGPLGLEED